VSGTTKATMAAPARAALDGEVRLAVLHLRVGLLVLARSELEDLERRGLLDALGRAWLAEARWRSGDMDDAATAARAHLDAGGDDPVALCIAAESAALDGRPGEARALIDRLGPPDAATLDALFAGMPRRAFWPSIGGDPTTTETLFGEASHLVDAGRRDRLGPSSEQSPGRRETPTSRDQAVSSASVRTVPGPREVFESTDPGLWPEGAAAEGAHPGTGPSLDIDPLLELAQAREELSTDAERALVRLSLVLRIDPTLAPAVLDAISLRREPAAELIRGDAQRLLGRHLEAEAAFARTADWLDHRATRKSS
jgi:hypothetical protein